MKILALGSNSTRFYTHNLWAIRRLEMQKQGAGGGCGGGMGLGREVGVRGVGSRERSPLASKRAAEGGPCS